MKKSVILLFALFIAIAGVAQPQKSVGQSTPQDKNVSTYKTVIYTSDDLSDEIQRESNAHRGAILDAGIAAAQGLAGGYVTSFIDLGVNAIASLITRNSRQKAEWEEMVKKENQWSMKLGTLSEVNDFYDGTSSAGAMDPQGMRFDGIGCLRTEGADTVFYVSCHIDRRKISRIINHSKFELVLDTLIISPTRSNLPNTVLDLPFSFEERRNFNFAMNIKLSSSWMTELAELQKDQELGEFTINIPVDQRTLDKNGYLRYVRNEGEEPQYKVVGESFIVPRSFMGKRDENGEYYNSWGTGEYKLDIELKETCDITDQYRENWKKDRKSREKMSPKKGFMESAWQEIKSQKWDEMSQTWVITILKGPANVISSDINTRLGFVAPTATQAAAGGKAQGTSGGAQSQGQPQGGMPMQGK